MPLYTVNPQDATTPTDLQGATQGAEELRKLKAYIATQIAIAGEAAAINVQKLGAKGDGIQDDSPYVKAALAAGNTIIFPPAPAFYIVGNVDIGTHKTVLCDGAVIKAPVGSDYIFKLTGFRPRLFGGYFDDGSDHVTHNIGVTGSLIVENASFPLIASCDLVNHYCPIVLRAQGAGQQTTKGLLTDINISTCTVRGVLTMANVNTISFRDIKIFMGLVLPDFAPKRDCIGFQIVSTGSTVAYGGHTLQNIQCLEGELGFQFTDAKLINGSMLIADSLCGIGLQFTGACDHIDLEKVFTGTVARGVETSGTSQNIFINGLKTILTGVVPPDWVGPLAYYKTVGPYFDVAALNTSKFNVNQVAWVGGTATVKDSGACINYTQKEQLYFGSVTAVPAGSTLYIGADNVFRGAGPTQEPFPIVAPRPGYLYNVEFICDTAPGAGKNFTLSFRLNGADVAGTNIVISDGNFAATGNLCIPFSALQSLTWKLVTDVGAAAAIFRIVISVAYAPYPN